MVKEVQVGNSTAYLQIIDAINFCLPAGSPEKNNFTHDLNKMGICHIF